MHYEKLPQDNGERMENEKLLKEIIMDFLTCSIDELRIFQNKLSGQSKFLQMNVSDKDFCKKIIDTVIRQKEGARI